MLVVLAEDESLLDEALSKKDADYIVGNRFCEIFRKREIPMSNVMVKDLSITELLSMLPNQGGDK